MTSCNATAPIDLPTKGNVNPISGTFNCVYDANMLAGQPVSLAQDLSHLAIKCNSNNSQVSFYTTGTYTPTEIRIYKPSLHTYNGAAADAELLIVHSINPGNQGNQSRDSDGLIVSVPISLSSGADPGLDAIVQAANTLNAGTVAMTSSAAVNQDVNANNFIPAKAYYVHPAVRCMQRELLLRCVCGSQCGHGSHQQPGGQRHQGCAGTGLVAKKQGWTHHTCFRFG